MRRLTTEGRKRIGGKMPPARPAWLPPPAPKREPEPWPTEQAERAGQDRLPIDDEGESVA